MRGLRTALWTSAALIAWTHVGYPLAVAAVASRTRRRPEPDPAPELPTVTLVIAAHDEERVIAQRLEKARALDYPADRLGGVVSLDGATDATKAIAQEHGVRVLDNPRAGKTAAQNAAVAATESDLVAF